MISGKAIAAQNVDRILITSSQDDSRAIRARLQAGQQQLARSGVISFRTITPSHIAAEGEDVTAQFISGPPGWNATPDHQANQEFQPLEGTREVFVVHGRNEAARDAMFQFLRALDLHPLEWPEVVKRTGKGSPTNMEIVHAGFRDVQAIVVLFTPDDEARLREPLHGGTEATHEAQATGTGKTQRHLRSGYGHGETPRSHDSGRAWAATPIQ